MHDNKNQYWFKARKYGYGWSPSSREGWLVTFIYIAVMLFASTKIVKDIPDISFFKFLFASTTLFIIIAWKTGEPLRWRWRGKK